jgi:hypothetical protein
VSRNAPIFVLYLLKYFLEAATSERRSLPEIYIKKFLAVRSELGSEQLTGLLMANEECGAL